MGQKVNPHGLRVGVIKDWDSRWYAREEKVGDLVVEDFIETRHTLLGRDTQHQYGEHIRRELEDDRLTHSIR